MNEIREQIKTEMQRRNLSGRKLAALLGIRPQTINDFIQGRTSSQRATQFLICQELGLTLDRPTTLEPEPEQEPA